jgi:DUF4097 and DUF4098 domain-containing protein YvlB
MLGLCALTALSACNLKITEEMRELSLPANEIEQLIVATGAGDLRIEGVEGLETIEATATIRRSTGPESVVFELVGEGGEAYLNGDFESKFAIGPVTRSMDVVVKVPQGISLTIADDSGDAWVGDVGGEVIIEDDSGELRVERIGGALTITDDSGDIDVRDVGGAVTIGDDSGELRVENVAGALTIADGSGNIYVRSVGGALVIQDDEGRIEASGIGGSATVADDSGDIAIDGVGGDLLLEEDGSGDFTFENVAGSVGKPAK